MFATLLGALPRPPLPDRATADELVEVAVQAQEAAGLEPITDGRLQTGALDEFVRDPGAAVAAWAATMRLTDRAVKQVLPGPSSLDDAAIDRLAGAVEALAAAGCPLVEIEETDLERLAAPAGLARFREAHRRFLAALDRHGSEIHRSLSLVGSAPPTDAVPTIIGLPYTSLAVDLIHGPDSWDLVARLPGDRGVIAGSLSGDGSRAGSGGEEPVGEPKEILLWAANYAASTKGRGRARVGLGSAGSWANLTWQSAVGRMQRLGDAARLAEQPLTEERVRELDPRAVSIRRAALGHDAPRPGRARPA